jgi:NarL family two-component system response regulator YdfI
MLEEGGAEFALIGEAADGETALQVVGELQPDVVLMDLRMPGMGGLEAIARIRHAWPRIAVVVLTTYNEDDLMIRGLQAGACGYLLKDVDLDVLLNAIRSAARGEVLVQPHVLRRILARLTSDADPPAESTVVRTRSRGSTDLTEREREVLARVALGERSKEIAAHLGIAERTIGAYLTSIYTKLEVDSRAAAVAVAIERGLLGR